MPFRWPFSRTTPNSVSEIDKLEYVINQLKYTLEQAAEPLQEGIFRVPGNEHAISQSLNILDQQTTKAGLSFFIPTSSSCIPPTINDLSGIIKKLLDRVIKDKSIKNQFKLDVSAVQKLMDNIYKNSQQLEDPNQLAKCKKLFNAHISHILEQTPFLRSLFDVFLLLAKNKADTKMDFTNILIIFSPKLRNIFSGKVEKKSQKQSDIRKEIHKNNCFAKLLTSFLELDLEKSSNHNKELPLDEIKQKKAVRFSDEESPKLPEKHVVYIVVEQLTETPSDEKTLHKLFIEKIKSVINENQKIIIDLTGYNGSISNLFGAIQLEVMKNKIPNSLDFKIIATDKKFSTDRYIQLFNFLSTNDAANLTVYNRCQQPKEIQFILLKKHFQGKIEIECPPAKINNPKL